MVVNVKSNANSSSNIRSKYTERADLLAICYTQDADVRLLICYIWNSLKDGREIGGCVVSVQIK
jgi:hypothetical protein